MPIAETACRHLRRAMLYSSGLASLRRNDVLLCSFPKSGNTWVRFFLYRLICQLKGIESPNTFQAMNAAMPELGVSNLLSPNYRCRDAPRIIKTHRRFIPLFTISRSVLIVRDPADTLVSYFEYARSMRSIGFDGTFSEFLKDRRFGLKAYFAHFVSWIDRASMVCRYESMKADPRRSLSGIAAFCGIRYTSEQIAQALEDSSISAIRKAQHDDPLMSGQLIRPYQFAGAGVRRHSQSYFSAEEWETLERMKRNVRFDERLEKVTAGTSVLQTTV